MTTPPRPHAGRFATGLFATLGIYVAAILLYGSLAYNVPWYRAKNPSSVAALVVFAIAVMIGVRQQHKGLTRLAAGYVVGAIVWPAVFSALFLAVVYAALSNGRGFTF